MRRKTRIIIDLVIILLVALAPWWFYVPAILAMALLTPFYWEGLILITVAQGIYGQSGEGLLAWWPLLVFVITLGSVLLRDELRV